MGKKRRILVAFEDSADADGPQKRQRKLAVSIDETAKNYDLAKEIATTLEQPGVTLALPGGFELRDQDGVEMIGDTDVVTARVVDHQSAVLPNQLEGMADESSAVETKGVPISHESTKRFQIRFVSAKQAVAYAQETPREQSEPTNGVLAFDGEFVSGNTTLRVLQSEAARVLGWISTSSSSMDVDAGEYCIHESEASCSCHIAGEIERHGLSTTFHCRFTIDGSQCLHGEACPYSHLALKGLDTAEPPHCSICGDALSFPCPACLARAEMAGDEPSSVVFCPLVQNAGCAHTHHAHCIGPRRTPTPTGCPSGCPVARFPREAVDFGASVEAQPHVVVAWDGDKISKIAVPGGSGAVMLMLTTANIVRLVEDLLTENGFAQGGLSMRVHFRDPVTECTKFTWSTLVSVCPSATHSNIGHRRFPLFSNLAVPAAANTISLPPTTQSSHFIDLHTANSPIVACSCTPIKELFAAPANADASSLILYAVKRHANEDAIENSGLKELAGTTNRNRTVSKESMYLADAAWQPDIRQSARGIAALLSSLYLLAQSVPRKGAAAEQCVLALGYAVLRFPPAIRTLACLFLNKVPRPEEKAALAEAVFHALKEFAFRAPEAIVGNESRRFETARIFLAYLASAADAVDGSSASISPPPMKAVEDVSLVCALSRKRLQDPVSFNAAVVERSVAALYQPYGPLYRPHSQLPSSEQSSAVEQLDAAHGVRKLLSALRGLSSGTALLLKVECVGAAPQKMLGALDSAGRDFVGAIRVANRGDLVSQGPLELKSVDVVPPRIVVDQEGLLAVFTGRGCGTTRDVQFFRPTKGGDTDVDVNDVSHSLERIIPGRKAEDTWLVDSFGDINDALRPVRPPDEAIIICLDLSESMNRPSGVQKSGSSGAQVANFDAEFESSKIVSEIVEDMSEEEIMDEAKEYLESLDASCHHPWAILLARSSPLRPDLLSQLAKMASRELLKEEFEAEDDADAVLHERSRKRKMRKLASFVSAAENAETREQLKIFLVEHVDKSESITSIGTEPFDVPRKFLDFKTGDLMTDPVHPNNAPVKTFVARSSRDWFEDDPWPMGHSVSANLTATQLKKAVAAWKSGKELLPPKKSTPGLVSISLKHGRTDVTWKLSPQISTRTLYSLANRATEAMYSSFKIKNRASNNTIENFSSLSIEDTSLAGGGIIELIQCVHHEREMHEFELITEDDHSVQRILVPATSPLIALLSYIEVRKPALSMTEVALWHGLHDSGDGLFRGTPVEDDDILGSIINASPVTVLECHAFGGVRLSNARQTREDSRTLTRLNLMNELSNIFLNRAGSFDTAASLVVGLVTFSSLAWLKQRPTPGIENIRQALERTQAHGDTAVYDALDLARRTLNEYRPDLTNIRKRIIIVSDGEDTSSDTTARDVTLSLQRAKIIVDSVQVGTSTDPVLHAISVATGGYRFSPRTSLADALSIFDLETMLYSGDRPVRERMPFITSDLQMQRYQNLIVYPIDIITVDTFPARAVHRLLNEPVKPAVNSVDLTSGGDPRLKRIMREIKGLVADPHPNIDVYSNDSNMSFLKVIVEAPRDVANCPYKGGTFLLTCDLPAGYPRDPPEVRFVTFILHPNVSKQGKVCIAELGRLWSSDITMKEIFSLVYGILLTPDLENPLEIQASLKYYEDDGTYALAVADAIKAHASKTRTEWREELES
ncbi:putative bifunctional E2/E3 enzyme [Favolaschia claudopus]|uniref:Bifunctional E2/E3 enzyme n=1 Tax=Favolaschia claudopus TaxID=2862362 RepID=A0AAW0DBU7_9AGAR